MSLLGIVMRNIQSSLSQQLPQGIRSQHLCLGTKTEQCAYQPIVLPWRAAKTQQSSLLAMFRSLSCAHLDKAVYAVRAFFLAFERVSFAVPEARGGIETTRQNCLLRGSPFRAIRDAQPLPRARAFYELLDKWRGIAAYRHVEVNSLQEVFSILLVPRGNQNLHFGEE